MTRAEFLTALRSKLSHLPQEEQDTALKHYEEYFDEAVSEDEGVRQLGSPEDIAARILSKYQPAQPQPKEKKAYKHPLMFWVGVVILCIFASPLLLSLSTAALIIALALVIVVIVLALTVVCPFLVLTVTFLACFALFLYLSAGAIGMFTPGAVLLAGAALLFGALGILNGIFTGYLCYWIGLLFSKIFKNLKQKKGAKA